MEIITDNNITKFPRIVLLAGGSFSPVTPMHLRMFEIARDYYKTMETHEVIGGIISPVHDSYGKKGLEKSHHRWAMLKLALQTSDWIRLSDWEIKQQQWSTTRKVLQYHENFINNYINGEEDNVNSPIPGWLPNRLRERKDKVKVKLLCGADLLESFSVPGLWREEDIEDIIGNYGLVVVSRKGSNPEQFIFDSDILSLYQKNITIITNWVQNEVSSSIIRKLLGRGQSVKYILDDLVLEYIKLKGLYNVRSTPTSPLDNNDQMGNNTTNLILFNDNYLIQTGRENTMDSITPSSLEEMDETDVCEDQNLEYRNDNEGNVNKRQSEIILGINRSKVFCCGNLSSGGGSQENTRTILSRPGQAVQIHERETMVNGERIHENDDNRNHQDSHSDIYVTKKVRRNDASDST